MVLQRVSVMMPAYNAEAFIAQAIESVLAQTYREWELLIVDDGSTDRTREVAKKYADPRITVLRQANQGEAAARNTALEHQRGEYVAFLDADDVWMADHLELTVGYLQTHADHDGVYTDGWFVNGQGSRLAKLSSRRRGPRTGRVFDEVVRGSDLLCPPLCIVLRQEPIRRHRLRFDVSIVIGPDWDFLLRFAETAPFGYVDRETCMYRLHGRNITTSVGGSGRASGLARCRMKAVEMRSFAQCPLDVRLNVFDDLLVNLLRRHPDRQDSVVSAPEFQALPAADRSRLLRVMASKGIIDGVDASTVQRWLKDSRALHRADLRGTALALMYRLSPSLCRKFLIVKTRGEGDPFQSTPFADLLLDEN